MVLALDDIHWAWAATRSRRSASPGVRLRRARRCRADGTRRAIRRTNRRACGRGVRVAAPCVAAAVRGASGSPRRAAPRSTCPARVHRRRGVDARDAFRPAGRSPPCEYRPAAVVRHRHRSARRQQLRRLHPPTNGFGDSQPIAIGIDNNGIVGPDRAGPRNMRRAPMVLNTAFFPALMWNGRFSSVSGDPFDNSAGFYPGARGREPLLRAAPARRPGVHPADRAHRGGGVRLPGRPTRSVRRSPGA